MNLAVPKMKRNSNLFDFTCKYKNWLKFEKISGRKYTDIENIRVILTAMDADGRYDKALNAIKMKQHLHEQLIAVTPSAPFPQALKLDTLPYTIMNCYSPDEKHDLFSPTQDFTNEEPTLPTINRLNRVQNPYNNNKRNNRRRDNHNNLRVAFTPPQHQTLSTS